MGAMPASKLLLQPAATSARFVSIGNRSGHGGAPRRARCRHWRRAAAPGGSSAPAAALDQQQQQQQQPEQQQPEAVWSDDVQDEYEENKRFRQQEELLQRAKEQVAAQAAAAEEQPSAEAQGALDAEHAQHQQLDEQQEQWPQEEAAEQEQAAEEPAAAAAAAQEDAGQQAAPEGGELWTPELQAEFEAEKSQGEAEEQQQGEQQQRVEAGASEQLGGGGGDGPGGGGAGEEPQEWTEELQAEFEQFQRDQAEGGHHPTFQGERFKDGRYTAVDFLGEGHYSTVWRVRDEMTGRMCAMKVVRSAPDYTAAGKEEVALLSAVRDLDPAGDKHCVRLLDSFEHTGPHGAPHVCEVFGVLGDDLLTLMKVFMLHGGGGRAVPLPVVRHLARQILEALDYLHTECRIIHTDLKPENIMLTEQIPEEAKAASRADQVDLEALQERLLRAECQLVDFGNAVWADREKQHPDIQTRPYRAPEVVLGARFGPPADIWSLGCLVFELVTGQYLFRPRTVGTRARDRDHLQQMMRLLGHMPRRLLAAGSRSSEFFSSDAQLWDSPPQPHWPLDKVLQEWHGLPEEEAMGLGHFLECMMDLNPARRYTAGELLEHPWLRGELPQRPPQPSAQWAAGPEATGARPSSVGAGGTQSTDGSTDGADGGS